MSPAATRLRRFWRPFIWAAASVVWLGAVVAGLAQLMAYDNRPGPGASAPAMWPGEARIVRDQARPTLVLLAHPRCDCTRASLEEFAEVIARAHTKPRAYVVFIRPGAVPGGWERTALWEQAARIPGVEVLRDDEGTEARAFGVQTSGQTLLYDAKGRLLFTGGTTGSRGKTGDNAGRTALVALLNGESANSSSTPVFGCSLFGPADRPLDPEGHTHGSS